MAEKDKLLRDLDQCKQQLNRPSKDNALDTSNLYERHSHYVEELKVNMKTVNILFSLGVLII